MNLNIQAKTRFKVSKEENRSVTSRKLLGMALHNIKAADLNSEICYVGT